MTHTVQLSPLRALRSAWQKSTCIFGTFVLALLFVPSVSGQQPSIFDAVRQNNFNALQTILDSGADPNQVDDDSDNVLINAAIYASADCMKLLLAKKANPNLRNKFGQTPLMYCSHDMDKMKLLLDNGADINAKSASGNTVLLIACVGSGQHETISWLLKNGADPMAKRWGAETALMRAALVGDTATISLLLRKGAEIDSKPWGFTALMYATRMGNWPCVTGLLKHGADPNIRDEINMPAVQWAAVWNNTEMVNVLLSQTTNINTTDSLGGMTPLMWACYNEHDNPQIIQAFLDKGADINIKAKNGATALTWAMSKGNSATVTLLRKHGAK